MLGGLGLGIGVCGMFVLKGMRFLFKVWRFFGFFVFMISKVFIIYIDDFWFGDLEVLDKCLIKWVLLI